ncbi:snRNA-activating protein complex subunit 3-like [Corticium candelabrum]|uniref:snRNA-activating protein complex subunit 3-like n=1 Tax=Corticium candelabrum TaxID=121492 RepID=UPI002E26FA20|nr:snRNA-activating protein complex subunit 3-like [Corticium candelabrum]
MSRGVVTSVDGCNEISPILSVREFFDKCRLSLNREALDCQPPDEEISFESLAAALGVQEETVRQLSDICHEDKLVCPARPEYLEDFDVVNDGIPEGVDLMSLREVKRLQEKKKPVKSRAKNEKEINHMPSEELQKMFGTQVQKFEPIEKPEVVLTITVYQANNMRVHREYLFLSSQPLYALRDCVVCDSDNIVSTDHSENPWDTDAQIRNKDVCKSAFLFIENIFYIDKRDPTARDYSRVIMDWASRRSLKTPNVGNMTSRLMEGVTFRDINIRLGFPYLYCHQGSCEHLVIFKDIRLLHCSDPQNRLLYPCMTFRTREYKTRCMICRIYLARWITVNDELAMQDPSFFCKKCFDALHYTEDGQKVCKFEAYPIMNPEKNQEN